MGLARIRGVFTGLQGEAAVVAGSVTARVAVGTGSIDTKNANRDKHLRSDDLLASDKFPDLIFVLSSLAPSPTAIRANGTPTVRDMTRRVVLETTVTVIADSEITLTSELDVDRRDYNMGWNQMGMASMKNAVTVKAVFPRD